MPPRKFGWTPRKKLKFNLVEAMKKELAGRFPIVEVDGVRVLFEDGWGLIRASNTQPALVLRFEARSPARLKEIQQFIEGLLTQVQSRISLLGLTRPRSITFVQEAGSTGHFSIFLFSPSSPTHRNTGKLQHKIEPQVQVPPGTAIHRKKDPL